jgi:flagellar hook-associated protein 1
LLSNFTNALQSYEASPSSSTQAAAAVTTAATLARGLNSATATVNQVREQADSEIATSVQTINALLAKLQPVNAQIINGNATGADVTDAQDTRDDILTKLSHEMA